MEDDKKNEDAPSVEDAKSDELGEAGKKAIKAERDARRTAERELSELKTKVKEFEDAGKSELEKLQGQVAELTRQAEAATAKADRLEVAADQGLTPAQARRLVGATREELEADAAAMAEELGLKKNEGKVKDDAAEDETPQDERPLGRPQENLRAGASNEADEAPDSAKLAESILSNPW